MSERVPPPLPAGWEWATALDACERVVDCHNKTPPYVDDGIPLLRTTNIRHGRLNFNKLKFVDDVAYERWSRRCPPEPGDVLYTREAPMAEAAIVPEGMKVCMGQRMMLLRAGGVALLPRYLLFAVQAPQVIDMVIGRAVGIGVQHLRVGDVERMKLPVAPLREQERIVEELEDHLSRLDVAVAGLERVQANLKRYRASVLKAAVEGRLVPTEAELARQEGRDYEPASVLLERILAERRQRWEQAELAKMKAKGKTPKNDKWKAKYKEPATPDTSKLPELPEGWCWTTMGQLKEFSLYGPRFSSDDYADDGVCVLRTSDISEGGKVDLDKAPKLPLSDADLEKYRCVRGDLLITRTGSIGTLAVFNDDVDAIPGAYLIQYRLAAPTMVAWFVFMTFKSPAFQRRLRGGAAGVGRPNLNAPTIESMGIALPPVAEQARIIEKLEEHLSDIDAVSDATLQNLARATRLRQAVLKWAFEGKLVNQDPSDEPASVLLTRIREQRAAAEPVNKTTKRRARKKKTASA